MGKKVLIIGGVAGGASAAARLRRLDEDSEIVLFERGGYISFANCGLPYYIGGTIEERQKLLVQTPYSMKTRFQIDVRIHSEVVKVDAEQKKVTVNSKENGIYEESFDYLILSPGAKPIRPAIPGIDSEKIYTLRNIPDTDRIMEAISEKQSLNAVVIGGGFIGVEMAENLRDRGLNVTLVEAAPHILAPFDSEMATIAEKELAGHSVKLHLGDGVKSFNENEEGIEVVLNSGTTVQADMVILAIGVTPDTDFLQGSGIELGPKAHIVVNDHMETNKQGIYAIGDAVEIVDYVHGQKSAVPLAGPANKQGRIAADNICGLNSSYKGTQGTAIVKIFGLTGASTGSNERTLKRLNIPYHTVTIHPSSHATYYPGAATITLKLIFDDEGKILGAQSFGADGVDKRIDVIATVQRLKGTVHDLTELELAYAPPYSSAKDPVNMAGYLAENVLTGKLKVFTLEDLPSFDPEKAILLDVRTSMEYRWGHLDGAINIPVDDLRERVQELDPSKEIWIYCEVGLRGYIAARILSQKGFEVKNMSGGIHTYRQANAI